MLGHLLIGQPLVMNTTVYRALLVGSHLGGSSLGSKDGTWIDNQVVTNTLESPLIAEIQGARKKPVRMRSADPTPRSSEPREEGGVALSVTHGPDAGFEFPRTLSVGVSQDTDIIINMLLSSLFSYFISNLRFGEVNCPRLGNGAQIRILCVQPQISDTRLLNSRANWKVFR